MERAKVVFTVVISATALSLGACRGVEADELGGAAIRPASGIKAGSARVAPGSEKAFNPQPEPPGKPGDAVAEKGFNPQPEPPARLKDGVADPVAEKGFNPQPEPPAEERAVINPGDEKAFNPQPEPPGQPVVNPVDGAAR